MSETGRSRSCEGEAIVNGVLRVVCTLRAHGGMAHHDQAAGYKWFDPWPSPAPADQSMCEHGYPLHQCCELVADAASPQTGRA